MEKKGKISSIKHKERIKRELNELKKEKSVLLFTVTVATILKKKKGKNIFLT